MSNCSFGRSISFSRSSISFVVAYCFVLVSLSLSLLFFVVFCCFSFLEFQAIKPHLVQGGKVPMATSLKAPNLVGEQTVGQD